MFKSLVGITTDLVKIAAAPVQVAVDLTRAVTKPIADAAQDVAQGVNEAVTDDNDPK